MKRRRRLLACLALVLLVGAALLHPAVYWPLVGWARGEALYRGRPSSYWSRELQRLAREDTASLPRGPGLLGELRAWLAGPLPSGFDLSGDPAAVAVLIDLLRDPAPLGLGDGWPQTVGHQAAYYLGYQHPAAWEGVPALAAGLRSADRATRRASVEALGSILFDNSGATHPNYQVGVTALQAALADEDDRVEFRARHYLKQLEIIAAARAERIAREGR